ncbi:MAG: PKD domain-containing protein [Flavobacteriales bacterium]|nr:PKD domain-containing protein [Flavobacteriales bacterium]
MMSKLLYSLIAIVFAMNLSWSQSDSALRAQAEIGLKVYYTSQATRDYVEATYNQPALQFKMKNQRTLMDYSKQVIDAYVLGQFNFDTIDQNFKTFLEMNLPVSDPDKQVTSVISPNADENPFFTNRVANGPCVNMDFEEGTLNGWEMYTGSVNTNPAEMVGATQIFTPGTQHTIMAPGADPVVGISTTNPNGGNFSLRLGDGTGTGGLAASVRQTFLVDANNAVFTYSYAVVLEDPSGHAYGEKPFFKVNIYDQGGNAISCGEYEVVASSGLDASWTSYGAGWYRDWQTVFAPLDAYIGQNVTIEFISGDCSQSGHYGYAYVDAECSPLEIIPPGTLICDGNPVTLSAPAGAASYLWNTGSTNQSISTSTPGNYSVDVIPVQGAACGITINATVGGSTGAPIADFDAAPLSVCVGESIDFTDLSTATNGATVDYWDYNFGDGSVNASTPDATHAYGTNGTYDVQFVAGVLVPGQGGCYDTLVKTVTVNESPTAAFSVSNVCKGATTQFTDQSTSNNGTISTWKWDFTSDGSIDNTQQNPSSVIGNDGTYTATLIVSTGGNCSDTVSETYYVHPIPVADFSWLDVCEGVAIDFIDESSISSGTVDAYQWDFGDLIGSDVNQNTSYLYGTPGQYNVVLTVTSDSGCIDSETYQVEMFANPVADFTFVDACENAPINFADASNSNGAVISTYNWDFTSDGVVDYSGSSTDYTYTTANTYDVTLAIMTNEGCVDTLVQSVDVYPTPVANFTGENICAGSSSDFTNSSSISSGSITSQFWDFGNGGTSTVLNPSEVFMAEGIYSVYLEVTSDQGCVASVNNSIQVYPNPVAQFVTADVCDGTQVSFVDFSNVSNTFTTNSISSWNWDFGTNPASGTQGQFANNLYSAPGTYTVTLDVTTNRTCTDSYSMDVVVYPNPEVSFESPNPNGCTEWCPIITNTSTISSGINNSYYWNLGDGTVSTDEFPVHCYSNNTLSNVSYNVSLTVTSDFGCATTVNESNFITVYPEPVAEFSHDPIVGDIYNSTIQFINESQIADLNNWNFANLGSSNLEHPSFTFPDQDSGIYEVCLHVETMYGCFADVCHDVEIIGYSNIYVPNTFTPDGDGINDYFIPSVYGFSEEDYELMIFDRWGLLIYATTGQTNYWDGTYKSEACPVDAYVWKIKATDKYTGEKKSFMGHINLLR